MQTAVVRLGRSIRDAAGPVDVFSLIQCYATPPFTPMSPGESDPEVRRTDVHQLSLGLPSEFVKTRSKGAGKRRFRRKAQCDYSDLRYRQKKTSWRFACFCTSCRTVESRKCVSDETVRRHLWRDGHQRMHVKVKRTFVFSV